MRTSLLLLTLLLSTSLQAKSLVGVKFEDTWALNGKKLQLNGLGLREATIFAVDVYVAGIYLDKPSQDPKTILSNPSDMVVKMHFVRAVDKEDMGKAMYKAFKRNSTDEQWKAIEPRVKVFSDNMISTKDGTQILFRIEGETTTIIVDGQEKGKFTGRDFAQALLRCWIGDEPPNEGLKEGMLGKKA